MLIAAQRNRIALRTKHAFSERDPQSKRRLFDDGTGHVDALRVRTFEVGSTTEGCVADDENGWLFISEEDVGIWRYGAEPGAGSARVQIDSTGGSGHLSADVEGLSIYYTAGGGGCLLASSQGHSRFVVYDRAAPHAYRVTFQIGGNQALGIAALTNPPLPIDSLYGALGVHRAATANAYGAGCGSPALGFVPDASGRPVLGQTGSATIVDAPTILAAVAMGWSNLSFGPLPLPLPLDSIGMPGCSLLQSADILGLGTLPLTASTCSFSLAIPGVPSLIGMHLYLQAYAIAPEVNPLQMVISNGIDWVLGDS